MKSDAITIKDIAHALDLSYSTVSRALKGSYSISNETKEKVMAYAREHNYRPNLTAQSLRSKQSRSLGIMLCSIPNNFFAEVINGIESVASSRGYHIIITQSHESYQKEISNLDHLLWRSVDGLIVSLSTETENIEHFEQLKKNGVPVVYFDRVPAHPDVHKVTADNENGAFRLTQHMLEAGCKRIAHVTSAPHNSITCERLEGYKKALAQKGLPLQEAYIKYCLHGGMTEAEIEQAIKELLSLPEPPDALLAASDRLTLKCFSILKAKGIQIPDEIALSGFSNFSAPDLFCPSLTTVVQPAFEIGKTATELLIKIIESKKPIKDYQQIVLPTELTIRNSTRKKG